MSVSEFSHKMVRATVIIGVSLFFLLPFTLPFREAKNPVTLKYSPVEVERESSPSPQAKVVEDNSWERQPVAYTSENLGINLPWLNYHDGSENENWLNTHYRADLIEKDLSDIAQMGVRKVRSFCQMESVFDFNGEKFVLNKRYAAHLDDYLNRAENHGIQVICVMGDGNRSAANKNLDGKLRLDLVRTKQGRAIYATAYAEYINHFKSHSNILMWELVNEPYGASTWSKTAKEMGITYDEMHTFIHEMYTSVKPLAGDTLVGFSDLEEVGQAQYELYSNDEMRKKYIDDSTDVYAMHIYRMTPAQIADFRSLTGKPKWALELGAYNYLDTDAVDHAIPAANELYNTDENYIAVTQISRKLVNSGFDLIMPWGFSANGGMVEHNPNGSHTLKRLPLFMKEQLHNEKAK